MRKKNSSKKTAVEMKSSCYIARVYNFDHDLIQDVFNIRGYEGKIDYTDITPNINLNFSDDSKRTPKNWFDEKALFELDEAKFAVIFRMKVRLEEKTDNYRANLSLIYIPTQEIFDLVKEEVSLSSSKKNNKNYSSKEELFKHSFDQIIEVLDEDKTAHETFINSLNLDLLRATNGDMDNQVLGEYRSLFTRVANVLLKSLEALQQILPVDQWNYNDPSSLKFPTNQISREPFFRKLEITEVEEKMIGHSSSFQKLKNRESDAGAYLILTIPEDVVIRSLDIFDYAVYSAYYTANKVYDNKIITFEELAKLLPHKSNPTTKTPKRFLEEIEDSINYLRNIDVDFNFTNQILNQAAHNKELEQLKELEKCAIRGHLIEAQIRTVRTKNSAYEVKGLIPLENRTSPLFEYSEAMKEFATIPVKMLETPLKLSKENATLQLFLAYQVANMPFNSRQKLLSNWPNKAKGKDLSLTPEKDRTITVKSILEKCRIDISESVQGRKKKSKTLKNVETIFDNWKSNGLIKDYQIIKGKGRSKEKYIIIPF